MMLPLVIVSTPYHSQDTYVPEPSVIPGLPSEVSNMPISKRGVEFLKKIETAVPHIYPDASGFSVGYGHFLSKQDLSTKTVVIKSKNVSISSPLSQASMDSLLEQDLQWVDWAIKRHVQPTLAQHQYDALASFVFNIGEPAFAKSTLLREINAKRLDSVPTEMRRWIHATDPRTKKKVIKSALVSRREKEAMLWDNQWPDQIALPI